jgi:iron complex outermembrane receptor protein
MLSNFRKHALLLGATAAFLGTAAQAQIEEVIVTANKREQTLQDIPISVTVTSAEQIEQSAIVDLIDLQSAVPTLRVTQLQKTSQTNFIIRGYGNGANNPGIEPAVGIYIDGVARTRSAGAMADLPTIERIEVLSGPQSTLFGKNASAGVISMTTRLPEQEFGGSIGATVGNYGQRILKGTVTNALSDTAAFRLSASTNTADGYAINLTDGSSLNGRDRSAIRGQLLLEPSDDVTVRIIADYNSMDEECCIATSLVDGFTSGVTAALATANGYGYAPIDPWARESYMNDSADGSKKPRNQLTGKGLSVQIDWDLDFATLTSITSHRNQTSETTFDADFSAADLVAENRGDQEFSSFSQEIRLASNNDGPMQWMVGSYYSQLDIDHFRNVTYGTQILPFADALVTAGLTQAIAAQAAAGYIAAGGPASGAEAYGLAAAQATLAPLGGSGVNYVGAAFGVCFVNGVACSDVFYVPGTGLPDESFTMKNSSSSLFGQVDYDLSDNLTATFGLNYTDDRKDVVSDVTVIDAFAALPFEAAGLGALTGLQFFKPFVNYPNSDESGDFNSDDLTHTLRLAYSPDEDTTFYASHSTGFKATSVSMTVDARELRSADPEEATLVEIGMKKSFDNGYINLAVFDQSIKGFQSNSFTGTGFNLVNAGQQTHKGVEFDSKFALSEDLVVQLSVMALDPVYDEFLRGPCDSTGLGGEEYACPPGQSFTDLSGQKPGGVHEMSGNANAVYSFNISDYVSGYARLEYVYADEQQIDGTIPLSIASRSYDNVNASIGLKSERDDFSLTLWGRNLTDHETLLSAFPTTAAPGSFSGYPNAPRTYGVTFRKGF